jgi:hypothetical protein
MPKSTNPRQRKLVAILSKTYRPGVNVEQLVNDLECLDVLRHNPPGWITDSGVRYTPATVPNFFANQVAGKKQIERMRDGLTALKKFMEPLAPEIQQQLARAAFATVENETDARAALEKVLDFLIGSAKNLIAEISQQTPASDHALQRKTKVLGVMAAFARHGVRIGTGVQSPFILVCKELGIPRATVQLYLKQNKEPIDELVKSMYGDK